MTANKFLMIVLFLLFWGADLRGEEITPSELLELAEQGKVFRVRGYPGTNLTLQSWTSVVGVIVSSSAKEVTVKTCTGAIIKFPKLSGDNLRERHNISQSAVVARDSEYVKGTPITEKISSEEMSHYLDQHFGKFINPALEIKNKIPSRTAVGHIANIDLTSIYVTLGRIHAISAGDLLAVFRGSIAIKDPLTGEVLGQQRRRIANLEVIDVYEKYSKAKLKTHLEIELKTGDQVESITKKNNVAILPFVRVGEKLRDAQKGSGEVTGLEDRLSSALANVLVKVSIPVVERDSLENVFTELNLGKRKEFDPTAVRRIGHQVGAGWLLMGTYSTNIGRDTWQNNGRVLYVNGYNISLKLLQVETGRVVWRNSFYIGRQYAEGL